MPAKKDDSDMVRVLVKLSNSRAKIFSSKGPLLGGSIVDLPRAEAERFMKLGCALPSFEQDTEEVRPYCDVESAANNPNEHGSSKIRHFQRERLNTDNAVVRTESEADAG